MFRDAVKNAFASKSAKNSAEWHFKELQERKVAWQRRLFAAMHPTIARGLPLVWRPCMLRKLWALGQGSKSSKATISLQLFTITLDEQDRPPFESGRANLDAWARKVISNSMFYEHGSTGGWKLKDAFKSLGSEVGLPVAA